MMKFLSITVLSFLLVLAVYLNTNSTDNQIHHKTQTIGITIDTEHNARHALDWAGTDTAELPYEGCLGIKTSLTLSNNGQYRLKEYSPSHNQHNIRQTGSFSWNDTGNVMTLNDKNNVHQYYIDKNFVIQLRENEVMPTYFHNNQYSLPKTR